MSDEENTYIPPEGELKSGDLMLMMDSEIMAYATGEKPCEDKALLRECRRFVCIQFRARGIQYRKFAPKLNISPSWACDLVKTYMAKRPADDAETIRRLQIDRLDQLLEKVWGQIMRMPKKGEADKGIDGALVETALKIMTKIDEAHGIKPPVAREEIHTEDAIGQHRAAILAALVSQRDEGPDRGNSGNTPPRIN